MQSIYRKASFVISAHEAKQFLADEGSEVAFAGRSNVGKSSVINALTGISKLARISRTPGRTQQINFFQLDEQRRLVDLPGYGYAKVPVDLQRHWQKLLEHYLKDRNSLKGLVLIMDARHPLKESDQNMLKWCSSFSLPVHILLNKTDKLSYSAAMLALKNVKNTLLNTNQRETVQLFSAVTGQGLADLYIHLDNWLTL